LAAPHRVKELLEPICWQILIQAAVASVGEFWKSFATSFYNDIMISYGVRGTKMAQFVVRNLENAVKVRLQQRARRHGRSMEEEVRDILRNAVNERAIPGGGLGTEISALFSRTGIDFEIPELRGNVIKPPEFEG
jgi:plasmid stability protein